MSKKEHHNRPDLIGEHRLGDAGQLISFILFVLVWISDGFIFKKTIFLNDIVPLYIRLPLAAITIYISAYLVITSISIIFGKKRDKAEVISKAIYGKMRHPMYVSEIFLYFGLPYRFSFSSGSFIRLYKAPSLSATRLSIKKINFHFFVRTITRRPVPLRSSSYIDRL